ncbi:LysR family transcriptional regulator [Mesorhizobium sp. YR577]|uniref:LysR family transcriptional regulator n=1 Tax=Mesorhizobium sp. YR577 TaxID=1884373 RepID=UPI0008E579C6|nr:LysR family transcriptional regulator [Mesorhizobium sp. YR577]SFT91772.1 DNA-binding transcriptional regulator, LysR family [Mesorhizobium sp. YR577]
MHFDLTDLRLFLAVIQAGSITHGAAEAHLSLPAASERLRGMELAGGVKLLERGRRGVAPTEAGDALAHHARLILRQMEHMQGELGEYANGSRATIRLLANTAAITEFLPDRLGPWLAAHRRIDVDLKERQSSEIVKAISAGLADIGIISDAVDSSGLELRPFAVDRLVVVVPRGHSLATARKIAFADILQHEFIGLAEGSALQDYIEAQAARTGTKLKFRMRVRTFEGICRLAAHGAGLGIVPETTARRCQRPMSLASLRLTEAWATRRLKICFRSEDELSPIASDMIAHLSSSGRE